MIYKLKYTNKTNAVADFIAKDLIDSDGNYKTITQGLVEIGLIEGVSGYHYDIMTTEAVDFKTNEIVTLNPVHNFWT